MTLGQIVIFGFLAIVTLVLTVGSYESKERKRDQNHR